MTDWIIKSALENNLHAKSAPNIICFQKNKRAVNSEKTKFTAL